MAGPAWDDEDEPTVIRPAPQMPPPGLVEKLGRRGTLWGVAGVLPPLGFLALVAVARQNWNWSPDSPPPEWISTTLVVCAIVGPLAGLVGGGLALGHGLRVRRMLSAAGVKDHAPAGLSLGWSAILFGAAGLGVALWMLGHAAASLR